jgi:predicted RNA-binding Zn-ribbon protein involved in translation (DUF1610 family)
MSAMVVIRCPETDAEVSVGIQMDLHTFELLPTDNVELKCPACGNRHVWSRKDAYLSLVRNGGGSQKR